MRVSAQHDIEIGVRSLSINLRRMGEQYGKFLRRNVRGGFLDIVHAEIMRVIDADEMNALSIPCNFDRLVEKHPNSHRFHARDHSYAVMIAQHAVHGRSQSTTHALQACEALTE